jgi:hypothetical protein
MKSAALRLGNVVLEKCKGKRHPFRFVRDGVVYPVKAHNGLKSVMGNAYIRGLCNTFDIDQAKFVAELHGTNHETEASSNGTDELE